MKGVPTCNHTGVNVKRIIDGVDGAIPEVPLAEGECTSFYTNVHHIRVSTKRDLR